MCRKSVNFIALFAGMIMGIAGGMLFAPTRGANARKVLSYRIRRYAEKLQELIKALSSTQVAVSNQAKTASQEIVDQTIEKAQQLLKDANELATQLE